MAPNGGINFADTNLPNKSGMHRYGQSKLGNVLHAKTLNKLYGPESPSSKRGEGEIWTAVVNPGLVDSELEGRINSVWIKRLLIVIRWFGAYVDGDTGSWTSVFCVASSEMKAEQSGTHFQRIAVKATRESSYAKDMNLANRLEVWTKEKMTHEGFVQ